MAAIARFRKKLTDALGPRVSEQVARSAVVLGTEYGGHCVDLEGLGPDSVIYSFGIGEDASFDVDLIARVGATVHAFDPTPRSLAWVEAQDLPAEFVMHPWAVGAEDGTATFYPPQNPEHVSHTVLDRPDREGATIEVPLRRLSTIMNELGHAHIDVLKLDVEGAEYAVLEDLIASGIEVGQALVEYHHQFEDVPYARTRASIDALNAYGMRVFHVSPNGREISLIRV